VGRSSTVRWLLVSALLAAPATRAGADDDGAGSKAAPATAATTTSRAKRMISGFRMEGDPEIEMVFGDTDRYQGHVDAFFELHEKMTDVRAEFQKYARATQTTLTAHKRGCPSDAVAPLYARAFERGQRYRQLGAELEANYNAIKALDDLGETSGLTPDYRWRVHRTARLYKASLVTYRELRAVFDDQLDDELAFRKCDLQALLTDGVTAIAGSDTATAGAESEAKPKDDVQAKLARATFFIDNNSCASTLAVYVDGELVGEVSSRAKAAFQTQPGRHAMCLIPSTSTAKCGDAGTVRSAYLHDGWSMTMRCGD
jgi:hypothetical protein